MTGGYFKRKSWWRQSPPVPARGRRPPLRPISGRSPLTGLPRSGHRASGVVTPTPPASPPYTGIGGGERTPHDRGDVVAAATAAT